MNFAEIYGIEHTEAYAPYQLARVTAEHRERYELAGALGCFFCRLKSAEYYGDGAAEAFPTVGDFVLVDYNEAGDSRII